jgi:hypothetical protein
MTATSREVLTRLQAAVLDAWQRGWQPAELVRVMRRRATPRHAAIVVDAIAAQMREYPAATVDDRWTAQLTEIEARVTWTADDGLLQWWALREGVGEPQILQIVGRVLADLHYLPKLPFAGPLPGQYRPGAPARPVDQRMLDRVRALLAKAESTTFPEEAEAYTAKAQELMARHSIDFALLVARGGARDEPAVRRLAVENPYEAPKTLLLQAVAGANRCRAVWMKEFGFVTVMGFPADLDSVELLFTSLLVQAVRAMTQSGNSAPSFRRSFLTSYAHRIGERLTETTEKVTQSAKPDLLPVLKKRTEEVDARFSEAFPAIRRQAVNVSNRQGWAEGRAAADRADLHGRSAVRA